MNIENLKKMKNEELEEIINKPFTIDEIMELNNVEEKDKEAKIEKILTKRKNDFISDLYKNMNYNKRQIKQRNRMLDKLNMKKKIQEQKKRQELKDNNKIIIKDNKTNLPKIIENFNLNSFFEEKKEDKKSEKKINKKVNKKKNKNKKKEIRKKNRKY